MERIEEFKKWLDETTDYTKETKSNILSRLRRANNIIPIVADELYLFNLSTNEEFKVLSVSVKSQIRRAVKLFISFIKEEDDK